MLRQVKLYQSDTGRAEGVGIQRQDDRKLPHLGGALLSGCLLCFLHSRYCTHKVEASHPLCWRHNGEEVRPKRRKVLRLRSRASWGSWCQATQGSNLLWSSWWNPARYWRQGGSISYKAPPAHCHRSRPSSIRSEVVPMRICCYFWKHCNGPNSKQAETYQDCFFARSSEDALGWFGVLQERPSLGSYTSESWQEPATYLMASGSCLFQEV